jgi:aminoglycoside phosphotransferase (APT) family kinase protein
VSERSADWDPDQGAASELIVSQFPDLAGSQVSCFGSGWDHVLFAVGPEWIFRFPLRAERVAWLLREIEILAVCERALASRIPRFERIGRPAGACPYPFVGYRRLAGVGADKTAAPDLTGLARDVGQLLSGLHRIDPALIPPAPGNQQPIALAVLRKGLTAVAGIVRPLLPADLRPCRALPGPPGAGAAPGRPAAVHSQ